MQVYTCYAGDGRTAVIVASSEDDARQILKKYYWDWAQTALEQLDLTKPSITGAM